MKHGTGRQNNVLWVLTRKAKTLRFHMSSSQGAQCIVNNPNGKLNLTFLTEKARMSSGPLRCCGAVEKSRRYLVSSSEIISFFW